MDTAEECLSFKGANDQNDFSNILDLDPDESSAIAKSKYYNVEDVKGFLAKHRNKLTVLSLNIGSLNSKFDELVNTLAESDVFINVICIQEARIKNSSHVEHLKKIILCKPKHTLINVQ